MCQQHHRNPIFCILPPHILRSIAHNGSAHQRQEALDTLATDNTLRAIRAGQTLRSMFGPKPPANVLAVEGQKQRTIYSANKTQDLPGTVARAEGAGRPAIRQSTKHMTDWARHSISSGISSRATQSTTKACP